MGETTTRGPDWPQESVYAQYYPRVYTAASKLVARRKLDWLPNHSSFWRLVVRGCEAADGALIALRDGAPQIWVDMAPETRVQVAVRAASRAMAKFLIEVTP